MRQELYDDLQRAGAAHALPGQQHSRPRRRPSGLTIVDHVGETASSSYYHTANNHTNSSSSNWGQPLTSSSSGRGNGSGGGAFSWLSGLGLGRSSSGPSGAGAGGGQSAADRPPAVRGLYMYGGVGCGKTMLMDLFVDTAPKHFRVGCALRHQCSC